MSGVSITVMPPKTRVFPLILSCMAQAALRSLVVVAVQDEHGDVDRLQVLGEVGLREGLDAVVLRLRAAHHSLAPPVVDQALRDLRARTVESVERAGRNVEVELRAVGG